nr:hypothetical protein [Fodinicola acaciae]
MRVDVHAHLWSDQYLDLLDTYGSTATAVSRGRGAGLGDHGLAARFALMDSVGIDTTPVRRTGGAIFQQ